MRINTNINGMIAVNQMARNTAAAGNSMEKLSTGLRINKAGDDAAGLAVSEKMRAQIRGMEQANRNVQDGVSLVQTAEGALEEAGNIAQRMRELAVQAGNDTLSSSDRAKIDEELNQLREEIAKIGEETKFNNNELLSGADMEFTIQAGANKETRIIKTENLITVAEQLKGANGAVSDNDDVSVFGTVKDGVSYFIQNYNEFEGTGSTLTFAMVGQGDTNNTNYYNVTMSDYGLSDTADKITINGIEIAITANDKISTVIGKINAKTANTGVVASVDDNLNLVLTSQNKGDTSAIDVDAAILTDDAVQTATTGKEAIEMAARVQTTTISKVVTPTGGTASTTTVERFGLAADDKITINGVDITLEANKLTFASVQATIESVIKSHYTGDNAEWNLSVTVDKDNGIVITSNEKAGADAKFEISVSNTTVAENMKTVTAQDKQQAGIKVTTTTDGEITSEKIYQGSSFSIDGVSISLGEGFTAGATATIKPADGVASDKINLVDNETAQTFIEQVDVALEAINTARANLGAMQNRLEYTQSNLETSIENLSSAESRIRDVDVASEMVELSKLNILNQAAQAMVAQAKSQPENVIQLLR
jgi:flagellin